MKQAPFPPLDAFGPRHIGPRGDDIAANREAVLQRGRSQVR